MKREADNNRIKRAIDHLNAAVTNIASIKWEHRTVLEEQSLTFVDDQIRHLKMILESHSKSNDYDKRRT